MHLFTFHLKALLKTAEPRHSAAAVVSVSVHWQQVGWMDGSELTESIHATSRVATW